jgi:hypothetical protein
MQAVTRAGCTVSSCSLNTILPDVNISFADSFQILADEAVMPIILQLLQVS